GSPSFCRSTQGAPVSASVPAAPAISLPIFSGGKLEGAYEGARAEYDLAVASYNGAVSEALGDVASVAISAKALDDRLSSSRDAYAAAKSAYDIAQNRYAGGLANYLDVLTGEGSLTQTRRAFAELETRAFTLDVALNRALGGGYRNQNQQEASNE